jgi:hypothetical protein
VCVRVDGDTAHAATRGIYAAWGQYFDVHGKDYRARAFFQRLKKRVSHPARGKTAVFPAPRYFSASVGDALTGRNYRPNALTTSRKTLIVDILLVMGHINHMPLLQGKILTSF